MQCMRPDIPPEPIQPNLLSRRPRPRYLKHPRRDPQADVSRHDLGAGNPLGDLTTQTRADIAFLAMSGVEVAEMGAGTVGQGFGSEEMCVKIAVALEDVEFVRGVGSRGRGEWPRAGGGDGVFRRERESPLGNAEVKVREDVLDGW